MRKFAVVSMGVVLLGCASMANTVVTGTRTFTDRERGLTVAAGTVELPAAGAWLVVEPGQASGLSQVQLVPVAKEREPVRGNRARKADIERQIEQERSGIWSLYWACSEYAKTNNGTGPNTWGDLRAANSRNRGQAFFQQQASNDFFLIPAVRILPAGMLGPAAINPLALQRHPVVDDGKHWVLYSGGGSDRVPIDKALCAKYGVEVIPRRGSDTAAPEPAPGTRAYAVSALVKPEVAAGTARLALSNTVTGASLECTWDRAAATAGDRGLLSAWARSRALDWALLAANGDAPVLRHWLSRCEALYGVEIPDIEDGDRRGRRGETVDAFSVLGGRAAVRETLQMQPLRQTAASNAAAAIAIATVAGVEVKSHPFGDMLKGVQPGALAMADNVPPDRAFVYFPKPDMLLPLLNGGAEFAFQGGSLAMANSAAYDLKRRYIERLALTDQWVRDLLLKSGAVKEMAVLFPDLFFIDGTEVTVLARIPSAGLLKPALGLLGIGGLSDKIQEKTVAAGTSFWVMDGDLLIIGTSRGEIERVRALRKVEGVGSLGRSTEFRYMLSQMPVRSETRAFCYLSDPLIRRLVGPEVKIGQLRRLLAKGEMENLSSAALLYRLDGHPGLPDVRTLVAKGYLAAAPAVARDCVLDARLAAACPQYGSPARMKTLLENPVTTVTPAEAAAYKDYMENYARFWRQYFDPMAFRLDDGPAGELQLATFILPLIDNTIYNGLKEVMCRKESGTPLRLPGLTPPPLVLLSANLAEAAWTKVTREMFSELLRNYTTLDPTAFDKIGPGVHLAVNDADPIITFGAGDTLGVFGAPALGRGGQEMLLIPLIASVLTRPCQLLVELQEPDVIRRMLLAAAAAPVGRARRRDPALDICKLEGRDAWICTFSIERIVNIRFGVEIQGGYLVLSNLPWSQKPVFGPAKAAELNTLALDMHPEAGVLQMPGLFTAACERERAAAVQGERYLYPLLACGAGAVVDAVEQSRALFGFAPEHPGQGQWLWARGQLRSTVYGNVRQPVQPEYKRGDRPFGILAGMDTLNLNLQFEDAGLRVVTRWKTQAP